MAQRNRPLESSTRNLTPAVRSRPQNHTQELKKGAGRKILLTNTPRRLQDDCLEDEAYIRLHLVYMICKLDRKGPKTIMSGKKSDISQFCELGWYDLVKICSSTACFPEDLLVLGNTFVHQLTLALP